MVAEVAWPVGGVVPKLGPDGRQLRAAGAIRVSTGHQAQGYSPQTQRAAILQRARSDGYLMDEADIFEDHESGHKLTRSGYVTILKGVRDGYYRAIYCFMLDRWGRDSIERQQRGKELDRLDIPVISVLEGRDEPGLVRAVRAELAEEESRRNAMRVQPNRERSARQGTHCGLTPFGYIRVYPEHTGGHQPAGQLVPHEPEASIVREMFGRYATGHWSTKDLALDLNQRGIPAPGTRRDGTPVQWCTATVCRLLRNPTYSGHIRFNHRPRGRFQRAAAGSSFVVEGQHEALIAPRLFAEVQRRLSDGRSFMREHRGRVQHMIVRHHDQRPVSSGLLRCAACGSVMYTLPVSALKTAGEVRCASMHNGAGCRAASYRLTLAEGALLAQLRRLRGSPWTPQVELTLAGDQGAAAAQIDRELTTAREKLARASRRFLIEIDEPSAEDRAVFEAIRGEMGQRIRDLEQQQKSLAHDAAALPRLRKLHEQLTQLEIGTLLDRLLTAGDTVGLRDLLTSVVASATLVERQPQKRSTWLRLGVTWTPDVQALLEAGLLHLADDVERPA